MADLSDVMVWFADTATLACYPAGPGTVSITGKAITLGQGWPKPTDVDSVIAANPPQSMVSIYAVAGSTGKPPQVFDFNPQTVTDPVHGITATLAGLVVTLTGQSNAAEYATLVVDGKHTYKHLSSAPESSAVIVAELLALVSVDYPSATASGSSLTLTGAHSVTVRIGAPGTIGALIHRQTQQIQVVIWSPNDTDRAIIGKAIDIAIKRPVRITMPDTSCAIVTYQGTRLSDREENEGVYRRDLIYSVEYDTVDEYQGFEITSVEIDSNALPNVAFTL